MVEALSVKVGNHGRKLVLIKLADNANDKGECWPSYQHVADQCEMGRSTVKAHIKQLEKDGFLKIEARNDGKSSNRYLLTISKGSIDSTRSNSDPVENKPGQNTTPTRSESDPLTRSESDPRTYHSFEPVIEPEESAPTSSDENAPSALRIETTQTADDLLANQPPALSSPVNRQRFEMHWDWQPSTALADHCRVMGVNLALFDSDAQELQLGEFRSYWVSQSAAFNQSGWEHKLAQHLKRQMVRLQETPPDNTTPADRRATVSAAISDLHDTNW